MAEITYAGYVPTSRPDYSALSNELAEKIYGVLDKRQERRTKLDEVEQANQKLLDSWIPGKTQTLNDFMLRGVDNMRKDLLQWNKDLKAGKMSESEYVRRNRNLEESYQMLANVLKSQDERVNTIMQRQEPDENGNVAASSYETDYLLKKFGEFTEGIKDKQIKTGSDGRIYLAKVDPETGLVTDQLIDVRSMALPENLAANMVNVPSRVEDITKNWNPDIIWRDLGLKGEENIETVKQKPGYKYMVEKAVNSIIPDSNPRAQVSVLVDNGVIVEPEYYDTDEEMNQILQEKAAQLMQIKKESGFKGQAIFPTEEEMKDIEISLIKNVLTPDGVYMPELTEEQKNLARERVRNEIDFSFSEKVTGTPRQPPSPRSSGGGGGGRKKEEKDPDKYAKIVKAWNNRDAFALQLLNDNSKFSIQIEPDGIAIYDEFGDLQHKSKSLDSKFMDLFFGNSATQIAEGRRQSQKYWAENPPTKKTTNKSTKNKGKGDNIFN